MIQFARKVRDGVPDRTADGDHKGAVPGRPDCLATHSRILVHPGQPGRMLGDDDRHAVFPSQTRRHPAVRIAEVGVDQLKRKVAADTVNQPANSEVIGQRLEVVKRVARTHENPGMKDLDPINPASRLNLPESRVLGEARQRRKIWNRRDHFRFPSLETAPHQSFHPEPQPGHLGTRVVPRQAQDAQSAAARTGRPLRIWCRSRSHT